MFAGYSADVFSKLQSRNSFVLKLRRQLDNFSKVEWRTCKIGASGALAMGTPVSGPLMGPLSAVLENSAGLYAERAAEAALSFGRCGLASQSDGRVAVQEPWTCRPAWQPWATAKGCTCKLHILKCLASTKKGGRVKQPYSRRRQRN